MNDGLIIQESSVDKTSPSGIGKYVTIRINKQSFAVCATLVKDVLLPQKITPVLLVAPEIIGLLNLRGRVVTAIDLRVKMGMEISPDRMNNKSIVIEHKDSLYSFVVDEVTGICDIPSVELEPTPDNLSESWKDYCLGIYKMEKELMVVLNVEGLLGRED